jgi:hypothetical protein
MEIPLTFNNAVTKVQQFSRRALWRAGLTLQVFLTIIRTGRGNLMQIPCDSVQEYEIPSGVTAVRIEAQSSGPGRHSSSAVTLQILRNRLSFFLVDRQ